MKVVYFIAESRAARPYPASDIASGPREASSVIQLASSFLDESAVPLT